MTACIKVITHLTEKQVIVTDTNGTMISTNTSNICITAPYDSYIVYLSNPVEISSFSTLLNSIDNIFIQFILFTFLIVIGYLFFVFLMTIKNKGFRGVK